MKTKMDSLTKVKLVYSGELLIFSIVFLVIGILEITLTIGLNDVFRYIFMWATPFSSLFIIADFVWTCVSKKKRKKSSMLDKCSLLLVPIYLIPIDIIMFINYDALDKSMYQYFIGGALLLFSIIYMLQGIYHWFRPLPSLLEEIEKERIDNITFKVLERNEDGSIIALHIMTNKKYIFKKEDNIKEEVDDLFCLDYYPGVTGEEIKE